MRVWCHSEGLAMIGLSSIKRSLLSDCVNYSSSLSPNTKKKREEEDSFGLSISHPTNQMAGLCWMAVTLSVLLYAGRCSAIAMTHDQLSDIVDKVWYGYALGDTFSLAVNVPQNQDPANLQQVFQDDPVDKVKQTVSGGQVYQGTSLEMVLFSAPAAPQTEMAGLCWMAVTLSVLLYAGSCFIDVAQNQLAGIVKQILERRYPMFSLAVSIPYDEKSKTYDISQVFDTDSADSVKRSILKCEEYRGTRMVAATVLRWPNVLDQCPNEPVQWGDVLRKCGERSMTWAELNSKLRMLDNEGETKSEHDKQCHGAVWEGRADHAEYRTLEVLNTLVNQDNMNDFLLFYVLASPCPNRCASESSRWSILESIKLIRKWKNYGLVFSSVFKPRDGEPIPEQSLCGALVQLGKSIGLSNIFRCNELKCTSCSSGDQVAHYCFSYSSQSSPSHNLSSTLFIVP
ncbi:hypothetical protein GBF38_003021 [Nibea albiflora]|uniref:Uncharacterized protein n=1 Tax=Nibea albiflora TaxID=240163 RepID=A0ACB7FK61_NIBAL|nr:hypothetical protein GBF38_003021 [Nibea albiflora]